MKVLHIIDSLGLGGAQTVVQGVMEAQKNNDGVFLYALRKNKVNIEIKHKNIFVYESTSKYSFLPLLKLRKLIKKEKIEVLHCHLMRSNVFGWLLKMFWFRDIKLIIHEHGGIGVKEVGYIPVIKLIKNKVDIFIAVSKDIKKQLGAVGVQKNKIKVLYNFVDLNKFKKIENKKKNDKFTVGFAGRLIKKKGWVEFVQSAKMAKKENLNMCFVIAGDGPDKSKLLNFIKENNLDNVEYIGHITDMVDFYNSLDCFIHPSHQEAMSISLLEVLACGVPVITSDIVSFKELINDNENGILFRKGKSNDLARKIKMLLLDEKFRNMLIKNESEFIKDFGINRYINRLNNVYNGEKI